MQTHEWWQQGVIYQIYPRSFQDSTGNGIGDLQGIIQRMDYLKWLGVSAIWLTPVYPSPQIDNGYDVADYTAIDTLFGDMATFEALIATAKENQIRVVLDMVFNHTSTEHPWFIEAASSRTSPWRDFYIWRDGEKGVPPNNWQSKFGGSAWQWHDATQQYYLHTFSREQADLNWENPQVREALKAVCHFWADKGVEGLRLDVINLISKHPDYPDDHQGDGRRFYTDGPLIHDFIAEMSCDVFQPRNLMTVGEMSSTSLEHCRRYARLDGQELSMTFNFHHLKVDYPGGNKWQHAMPDWLKLKEILNAWQSGMHGLAWNALFWCNHDQPRIVSRLGNDDKWRVESAKMLAMLLHGMQGTPFIYQGEEIGMTNPNFTSMEQYRDVESLNIWHQLLHQGHPEESVLAILADKSRDNGRTPMQWDEGKNSGFTSGKSWIPLAGNASSITVKQQILDKNSVLSCYRHLIQLRKELPVLRDGNYLDLAAHDETIWCYQRESESEKEKLHVIANITGNDVDIPEYLHLSDDWCWLTGNYPRQKNQVRNLRPYECIWWLKNK